MKKNYDIVSVHKCCFEKDGNLIDYYRVFVREYTSNGCVGVYLLKCTGDFYDDVDEKTPLHGVVLYFDRGGRVCGFGD